MSWLKRFERLLEPIAISRLTLYLVAGQAFVYLTVMLGLLDPLKLVLVPAWVMQGGVLDVLRLFSFMFFPPNAHWVLIAFALYFLYFTGNTLEEQWGTARYNLYVLTAYVLTVAAAFVTPGALATNAYIGGIIFLAFAYLHPNFVIHLFLILPVKVKWVAAFIWVIYALSFFRGGLSTKLSIMAAVGTYLLFLGPDILLDLKTGRRRMQTQAKRVVAEREAASVPRHRCYVCGKDSNTHPDLDFRYCSKCAGDQCYCPEHIQNHAHVVEADEKASS